MGWNNPPMPWREFSDRLRGVGPRHGDGRPRNTPPQADGGDSPAWSRTRLPYEPPRPATGRAAPTVPYGELHCHSNFSFLDGASHPEELAEEAARLGLEALALTDHNGLYGVVRFAEAAGALGLRTVFGAELSIGQTRPGNGVADPDGHHLVVIARDPSGYAALSRAVSLAQLRGRKASPVADLSELGELAGDHWLVLTGCRKGGVPRALMTDGLDAARRELDRLIAVFGRRHVKVELWDHGDPLDTARNDALADLATRCSVETVVTNNVHYATPQRWGLASAVAAVRARRSLDELDGWLPPAGTAHLRSGDEQAARFARYPGAVEATTALAISSSFDLRLVAPQLPDFPVPTGHTEDTWLRQLTMEGALRRYGPTGAERVPGAYLQIGRELAVIAELDFPGYFLIVWDIVEFCRRANIYCQGRGSAANSAVCYALGITKADPVALKLLFERFLSPARDGPPDIDLDIESGRREEVIQYVYGRYGRHHTAQVANVITYRPRSAIRDAGRALGFSPGQLDRWARQLDGWGPLREVAAPAGDAPTASSSDSVPAPVVDLAAQLEGFPRHLGIHSGGMVICDRPVIDVCPVEWATMPDRSVLQWDKDDCAAIGLVKFDLLGLGMLEVLHRAVDLIATHQRTAIDLAMIPQEDAVYRMLCRADSIGLFQVESRAQMATLPRLKPRDFYDLVIEVALIRPGPIQGGSVHPFIRRHNGQEEITYLHPLLERPLHKTLGVPLFQEQMMEIAVEVAGFTATEADELRQAMGAKRSHQRMERLRERFYAGMATRGITGETADAIYHKLLAFANFGFPESHSVSFAYLVYASAWLKLHHPAAFLAALLNSQPMGFWSPQTLIADAARHGVVVRDACVHASAADATLEPLPDLSGVPNPHIEELPPHTGHHPHSEDPNPHILTESSPQPGRYDERIPAEQLAERAEADRRLAVRLGLSQVRTVGDDLAERITANAPYDDLEALMRRCQPTPAQAEALATSGALAVFEPDRRRALWAAGAAAKARPDQLERTTTGITAPTLTPMTLFDEVGADLWATGVTTRASPMQFVRDHLRRAGVLTAADLDTAEPDKIVAVGGLVTHRQRPATAGGTTFMNLEDETGLVNVICSRGVWTRYRTVARTSPALVVHGRLERAEGVVNLVATRLEALDLQLETGRSRDFR